jgi:hypothetical protein
MSNNVRASAPLQVGMKVRIASKSPPLKERKKGPHWTYAMSDLCGREGVIEDVLEHDDDEYWYRIEIPGDYHYDYLPSWFEVLSE